MNWNIQRSAHKAFIANWQRISIHNNIVLFSGDQKLEHLHRDFYGPGIDRDDNDPEHLFSIATTWLDKKQQTGLHGKMGSPNEAPSGAKTGALVTQLGLIEQFGLAHPTIPYIVKLNGMTHTVPTTQMDPYSTPLWSVTDVVEFNKQYAQLSIVGVACTVYVGSEYESEMLTHAAQMVRHAHKEGLVAVLFIYPRGKAIQDQYDGQLLAGCAGLAATLGADVVKLNPPEKDVTTWLPIIAETAGKTRVVFSGGQHIDAQGLLKRIATYVHHGIAGVAVGRNIHQRPLREAVDLLRQISSIVHHAQ